MIGLRKKFISCILTLVCAGASQIFTYAMEPVGNQTPYNNLSSFCIAYEISQGDLSINDNKLNLDFIVQLLKGYQATSKNGENYPLFYLPNGIITDCAGNPLHIIKDARWYVSPSGSIKKAKVVCIPIQNGQTVEPITIQTTDGTTINIKPSPWPNIKATWPSLAVNGDRLIVVGHPNYWFTYDISKNMFTTTEIRDSGLLMNEKARSLYGINRYRYC